MKFDFDIRPAVFRGELFSIEDVRIEWIVEDLWMVLFDVITPLGRVELAEYMKFDEDGEFLGLEDVDSNINAHLSDEIESVFLDQEDVPMTDVLEAVNEIIMKTGGLNDPRRA